MKKKLPKKTDATTATRRLALKVVALRARTNVKAGYVRTGTPEYI
jgi:hypothetical protein